MATIFFMPFYWASDLNPTFALTQLRSSDESVPTPAIMPTDPVRLTPRLLE